MTIATKQTSLAWLLVLFAVQSIQPRATRRDLRQFRREWHYDPAVIDPTTGWRLRLPPVSGAAQVTKWMESGTSATYGMEHWSSTSVTSTGVIGSSPQSVGGSPRSIAIKNGVTANSQSLCIANAIMADAGRRCTFYVRFNQNPASGGPVTLCWVPGTGATCFFVGISAAFKLVIMDKNLAVQATGATTLVSLTDYRVSFTYTITSAAVNSITVYLNGSSDVTATNITSVTGSSNFDVGFLGSANAAASSIIYCSHIFVDDGTSGDVGDIRVTAKRPYSNGTLNEWTTQLGTAGSIQGTGHAVQVNQRPLTVGDGWTISNTTIKVEEYNIESRSQGDRDLTNDTIVDYSGWVYAKFASAANTPVSHIIVNGVSTVVVLTTSNAMYTKIAASSTYPAGTGTDIGIDGAYTTTPHLWTLMECGILFAYTPGVTPLLGNMQSLLLSTDLGAGMTVSASRYSPLHMGSLGTASSKNWNSTETNVQAVIASPGVISNLAVNVATAPGSGKSWAMTVYKNGSATALTCTISDTNTQAQDATHNFSVVAGDRLTIQSTPSGTPTGSGAVSWGAVFTGSNTNEYAISGTLNAGGPSNSATNTISLTNSSTTTASIAAQHTIFNSPVTITAFYLYFITAVATGTWAATILVNGTSVAETQISVTSGQTGSITGLNISVGIGDYVGIQFVPTTTPTASDIYWSIAVQPYSAYAGESIINTATMGGWSTAAVNYAQPHGGATGTATGTEGNIKQLIPTAITTKRASVILQTATGAAKSYTFKVRKNGADGNQTTGAITNGQNGNDLTNIDAFAALDFLNWSATPAGTPTASNGSLSLVVVFPPQSIIGTPFGKSGQRQMTQLLAM